MLQHGPMMLSVRATPCLSFMRGHVLLLPLPSPALSAMSTRAAASATAIYRLRDEVRRLQAEHLTAGAPMPYSFRE